MAFECPRRSSPPSPMFDADTGCIATDPAPSARRRFRSKTGIENLPANEHAQETPHTPSPTRTTRRIQSGCAGSRPRLRDGMPGSPSQHIDITRAKWIPYFKKINALAHDLKGQGGTFGYPLITTFADSLFQFTDAGARQTDNYVQIVQAHIDSIRAVVAGEIRGDGGQTGRELRLVLYQRSLIRTHAPICACRGT